MKYEYKIKRMIPVDGCNINAKKSYNKESFIKATEDYLNTYRPTNCAYISRNIHKFWEKPLSDQFILDPTDIVGKIENIHDEYCDVKLMNEIDPMLHRIGFALLTDIKNDEIIVNKIYRVILYDIRDTFYISINDIIQHYANANLPVPQDILYCRDYIDCKIPEDDVLKAGKSNDIFDALNYIINSYRNILI